MKDNYQENANNFASAALTSANYLRDGSGDLDRAEKDLIYLAPLKPPNEKSYTRDPSAVADPGGEKAAIKNTLRGSLTNLDRVISLAQQQRAIVQRLLNA